MKDIKKDLEIYGWANEIFTIGGDVPVLFVPFAKTVDKLTISIIKKIVDARAQVKAISVGTFHAIIISK